MPLRHDNQYNFVSPSDIQLRNAVRWQTVELSVTSFLTADLAQLASHPCMISIESVLCACIVLGKGGV